MKTNILSLAFTSMLGLSVASGGMSFAHASSPNNMYKHGAKMFAGLDLSQEQKQDIGEILRQSMQDNSVYEGEKKAFRAQMKSLMQSTVWDASLATDLATQRVTLTLPIELNKAKARNAAFLVLTANQQASFSSKQAQRAEQEPHQKEIDFDRLQKRLELSDEQVESLAQIQAQHFTSTAAYKEKIKAHKQAEQSLIFAQSFDEAAWAALQAEILPTSVALDVARGYTRFQMLQLLDEKQRSKFERIMAKHAKKGKGKSHRKDSANY